MSEVDGVLLCPLTLYRDYILILVEFKIISDELSPQTLLLSEK